MAAHALESWASVSAWISQAPLVVFLDYDGTLSPIVDQPQNATMSAEMRAAVKRLSERVPVTIITGRSIATIRTMVSLDSVFFAGSHGFEIVARASDDSDSDAASAPRVLHEEASAAVAQLTRFRSDITARLQHVDGVMVEDNRLSVSVHYRHVAPQWLDHVSAEIDAALAQLNASSSSSSSSSSGGAALVKRAGKMVWEIRPAVSWNKGEAVRWMLTHVFAGGPSSSSSSSNGSGSSPSSTRALYVGDDVTDEDAFRMLRYDSTPPASSSSSSSSSSDSSSSPPLPGVGVHVRAPHPPYVSSVAPFFVRSVAEVHELLERLLTLPLRAPTLTHA